MKSFFASEDEMQSWLANELEQNESLADLICNLDELDGLEVANISERKILESFQHCKHSLYLNTIISNNENISLKEGDSLKPDFLLYAAETESIVIVELKNIANPTRQAGTEISAYASEVKSYIPFISEGDIINVLISPIWPTLLRHYVFHEIFWLQKNIICLEPTEVDGKVQLKVIDISCIVEDNVTVKISPLHLGGYQLCLYDDNLYKDRENRTRLDPYIEQMKTAISAIEKKANSQKNHGFAFLWKDHWDLSLAPYSITIVNFAPFQSVERLFHDENFKPSKMTERFVNLMIENDPNGHGESLNAMTEHAKKFLGFCSPRAEGFHTWDDLKEMTLPRAEFLSFHSWGIFGEIFSDKLSMEYENGNTHFTFNDPDLGLKVLDELIDPNYEFINLSHYNYDPESDGFFDDEPE